MKKRISTNILMDIFFVLMFIECIRTDDTSTRFIIFFVFFVCSMMLVQKNITLYKPNIYFLFKFLFILVAIYTIKSGNALYTEVSYDMIKLLAIDFFCMYFVYLYIQKKDGTEKIIDVLIVASVLLGTYALLNYIIMGSDARLGSNIGYNANMLALAVSYVCTFVYYKYLLRRDVRFIFLIGYLLLIITLTGSRKGLITCLGAMLFINLVMTKTSMKAVKILSISFAVVVVYVLLISIPFLYNTVGYRIADMVNFLIVGDTDDASLIVRNELIKTAWAKIAENPWTGYGLNSFRYFDYRDLYTHNNFVEVLFSGGIPLLAVYYVLNLWIIIQAIRCYKRTTNKELIATVMALEIVMIFSDIGMVSYYTKFVMIMQLFLVCIVNKCKNSEEGISEQQE